MLCACNLGLKSGQGVSRAARSSSCAVQSCAVTFCMAIHSSDFCLHELKAAMSLLLLNKGMAVTDTCSHAALSVPDYSDGLPTLLQQQTSKLGQALGRRAASVGLETELRSLMEEASLQHPRILVLQQWSWPSGGKFARTTVSRLLSEKIHHG